jgi:uncharacterized protein
MAFGENGMAQRRERVLVTGASSGIGRAMALVFAEHDFDVILVARSADKLESLAESLSEDFGAEAHVFPMDLSKNSAPKRLFGALQKAGLEVDVLVNNAGVAITEPFHESTLSKQLGLVQLNVVSLTALTKLFLDPMIARGSGRILNVASVTSFFPTPSFATYGASKAYVLSFTEALAEELKGTGVTATALCPGYTETDMISGAFESMGREGFEHMLPSFVKLTPERVAREGYRACMRGKPLHVDRLSNDLAMQWIRLQPKWLVRTVGGYLARMARE